MALRIRDDVDLKELEKFGFKKQERKEKTQKALFKFGLEEYFIEVVMIYDNGINTLEIVEKRENSDWKHPNKERELYIYANDHQEELSKGMLDILYDLIKADLVVKE